MPSTFHSLTRRAADDVAQVRSITDFRSLRTHVLLEPVLMRWRDRPTAYLQTALPRQLVFLELWIATTR